ncbi:MAG: ACT domain-containing protein [Clostridiales bacterium]|nr:ACT domain-containing protein [Clostridiales bacterium]
MKLKTIPFDLTVCKLADGSLIDLNREFYFIGKTDEELSLVCRTEETPSNTTGRDDGWRGFRIEGVLDFSLIGILSKLSSILAQNSIGIFAVSTYNTDYILVKKENFDKALSVLAEAGYKIDDGTL